MTALLEPGLKRPTVHEIRRVLVERDMPLTAEAVGREAGVCSVTARVYLRRMAKRREVVEEHVPWGGRTLTYWRALGPDEVIG
jgi:response regulator of citrate/malate metabolism